MHCCTNAYAILCLTLYWLRLPVVSYITSMTELHSIPVIITNSENDATASDIIANGLVFSSKDDDQITEVPAPEGISATGSNLTSFGDDFVTQHINTISRDNDEIHSEIEAETASNNRSASEDHIRDSALEKNYLLAANYIEDARFGRTMDYNIDKESLLNYRRYSRRLLQWGTVIFMWWLLLIGLFEDPAVPGLALPYWATMLMEVFCLVVICFRMYQLSTFVPRRSLLTDPKNIVIALTIVVTVIDMIIYIGMINSPIKGSAIRVSRVVRPLFMINMNESRQVRRAFRNIRNTVPEIINVLILFFFSIALFTLLAFKLFQLRDLYYRGGEPYFRNYWDSFFDLYVLVTTANSPDVMMPAYDDSPWFALFFIAYIVINTYIFMNLFLAVIYNSYRAHLKTEIRSAVLWKRKKLENAFEILKDTMSGEKEAVTYNSWIMVMKNLTYPPSFPKISLFWEVLNNRNGMEVDISTTADGGIELKQFLQLANLMNVYVVEDQSAVNIFVKWAPEVYASRPSKFVRKCVQHWSFVYLFDLLILMNAVCIAFDWESTEWFFLSIFIVEILLRMYTLGPKEYFSFSRFWNWFDFIIITSAFIATVIEASLDELAQFPREALDFLMVMRCLRLVKIVGNIDRFRIIVMTIVNIAPSLLTYGIVLLMLYYAFAIVGMECFGGKIKFTPNTTASENNCNNTKLEGSEFLRMGYCNNNFNDILHSLVTLVELTVVNQWHIITLGYSLVTSKAARVYFIFFHLIVVILIMNIIVAFVLEAFILEYQLSKTTIETAVEKTIQQLGLNSNDNIADVNHDKTELINEFDVGDNDQYSGKREPHRKDTPKIRFRINQGHKNIEVLLQRMFEGELEGEGFEFANAEEPMTLDGVTGNSVTV
ncbi:two pore calcium channel protein 1-like [Ciona intestinalis]